MGGRAGIFDLWNEEATLRGLLPCGEKFKDGKCPIREV